MVLRVLDKSAGLASLEDGVVKAKLRGADQKILGALRHYSDRTDGVGEVNDTLWILNILNKEERNIVTLEDPVEYFLDGINQSQVKPEIGYTFASGLRSIFCDRIRMCSWLGRGDNETRNPQFMQRLPVTWFSRHCIPMMRSVRCRGLLTWVSSRFSRLIASSSRGTTSGSAHLHIAERVSTPDRVLAKIRDFLADISPEEAARYHVTLGGELPVFAGKVVRNAMILDTRVVSRFTRCLK